MTTYQVHYRLEIRAPKSVDFSEATVLTPAAGAPHSDPFRVTTHPNLSGWKPYLDTVTGRRGRIELKSRGLDVGNYTVVLLDKETATGELLKRWWSTFFGDTKGRPRGRLKVVMHESLDDGVTWNDFVVGRLLSSALEQKVAIVLGIEDESDALKMSAFVGEPHSSITYAAMPSLLPIGLIGSDYGLITKVTAYAGTVQDFTINGTGFIAASGKRVVLSNAPPSDSKSILTKNLFQSVAPNTVAIVGGGLGGVVTAQIPNFTGSARVRIKHLSGALSGQTGDYKVGGLGTIWGPDGHHHVSSFAIAALDSGDRGYLALPAAGVSVEVFTFVDEPVSEDRPILLNDVDPAQHIEDLCDGKFGYLFRSPEILPSGKSYGDAKSTVARVSLAAFKNVWPPLRDIIKERTTTIDRIENLCRHYHWAPYLDKLGRLNLVDLRLPSSLAGISTLVDVDLVEDIEPEWEHDSSVAITRMEFTRYTDKAIDLVRVAESTDLMPEIGAAEIEEFEHPLIVLDIGSIDFGDEVEKIDATGYRSMDGETLQDQPRSIYLENTLLTLANHFRRPYGYGATTIVLPTHRSSATVQGLTQGGLVLVNCSVVPDPATHQRGGSPRLCRILEMSEDGEVINLRLIDLAVNIISTVPTLGVPAQESGNTYSGVTTVLTLNASTQPAEVRYAVTDTVTSSAPADTSQLWVSIGVFRSSQTITIRNLPPNRRIWVQGRTLPDHGVEPQLPSAWVLAAAPGRVDTAALPAPSSPIVSLITNKAARVSWTNGATDLNTEILLATPTTDPRIRIGTMLPGSVFADLDDLDPSTTYRVGVRHAMGQHVSVEVTADFTTAATGTPGPALAGIDFITGAL